MEIVTSWITLFALAKAVGEAHKSGDPERIAKAEAQHREYERMCLRADRMIHGPTLPR